MENASKALLIAAAVLIVIVLVGFGMQVFNSASNTSEDVEPIGDWMSLKSTVAGIHIQFGKYNGNQKGSVIHEIFKEAAEYNKNSGAYVPGDDTTQLKRKISISITKKVLGDKPRSTTSWNNILDFMQFIDANTIYNVNCREYLDFDDDPTDEYERKHAIYLITIDVAK